MGKMKLNASVLTFLTCSTALAGAAFAEDEEFNPFEFISVNYGTSYTKEKKTTTDYDFGGGGTVFSSDYNQFEAANILVSAPTINATAQYSLSFTDQEETRNVSAERWANDGVTHNLILGKKFALGNGYVFGLGYTYSNEKTERDDWNAAGVQVGFDEESTVVKQAFQPSISYYNNNANWGFFAQGEIFQNDTDSNVWWSADKSTIDERGFSLQIEPYTQVGSARLAVQFYHQQSDLKNHLGATNTQVSEFTESYVQPSIVYALNNGGTLSLRARFGEKKTEVTGGAWATPGDKFFTDVKKLTLGYEQDVGDWQLRAEIERSWETETTNAAWAPAGAEKTIVQDKINFGATLRF